MDTAQSNSSSPSADDEPSELKTFSGDKWVEPPENIGLRNPNRSRKFRKNSWDMAFEKLQFRVTKSGKLVDIDNWNSGKLQSGSDYPADMSDDVDVHEILKFDMKKEIGESVHHTKENIMKIVQEMAQMERKLHYEQKKRLLLEVSMLGVGLDLPDPDRQEQMHELSALQQSIAWLAAELRALTQHMQRIQLSWIDKIRREEQLALERKQDKGDPGKVLTGDQALALVEDYMGTSGKGDLGTTADGIRNHLVNQIEWTHSSLELEKQLNDQLEIMLLDDRIDPGQLSSLVEEIDTQTKRPSRSTSNSSAVSIKVRPRGNPLAAGSAEEREASPRLLPPLSPLSPHFSPSPTPSPQNSPLLRADSGGSLLSNSGRYEDADVSNNGRRATAAFGWGSHGDSEIMPGNFKTSTFAARPNPETSDVSKTKGGSTALGKLLRMSGDVSKIQKMVFERTKEDKELKKWQKELEKQMERERKEEMSAMAGGEPQGSSGGSGKLEGSQGRKFLFFDMRRKKKGVADSSSSATANSPVALNPTLNPAQSGELAERSLSGMTEDSFPEEEESPRVRVEGLSHRPNELAEEIVKCMIGIYKRHSCLTPLELPSPLAIPSPSPSRSPSPTPLLHPSDFGLSPLTSPLAQHPHQSSRGNSPSPPLSPLNGDPATWMGDGEDLGTGDLFPAPFNVNSAAGIGARTSRSGEQTGFGSREQGTVGVSPRGSGQFSGQHSPPKLRQFQHSKSPKSNSLIQALNSSLPRSHTFGESMPFSRKMVDGPPQAPPRVASYSASTLGDPTALEVPPLVPGQSLESRLDRLQINLQEIESALREISGHPTATKAPSSGSGPRSALPMNEPGRGRSPGSSPSRFFSPPEGFLSGSLDIVEANPLESVPGDPYGVMGRGHPCPDIGDYFQLSEVSSVPRDSLRLGLNSALYTRFKLLCAQLENVDPSKLSHEQKLAFWINIFNALVMNTYLTNGVPSSHMRQLSLLHKSSMSINHHSVNALTIEYCVLRARSHRPPMSKLLPIRMFKPGDDCYGWILSRPEPLVSFALSTGTKSSPAVRMYTSTYLREELQTAKEDFLRASIGLTSNGFILLPKLLDWYGYDFASSPAGLLEWVTRHLPSVQRISLLSIIDKTNLGSCVAITPFDWNFRYLLDLKSAGLQEPAALEEE